MTFTKDQLSHNSNNSTSRVNFTATDYIVSCDVGTTTLRCFVYKTSPVFSICGTAVDKIQLVNPQPDHVEINPDDLWEKFLSVIRRAIEASKLSATDVKCMGLSTQRGTFILWDRQTGKPFHNFITWKDMRADDLVQYYNKYWKLKLSNIGSGLLYFLTRKKRFLAASILKFMNIQVSIRLKWVLEYNPEVRTACQAGNLMFGTIDTWLVYKLTGGKVYATDHSNASGTAIYDPFILEWSSFLFGLIDLPSKIFPEIINTSGYWGETQPELFDTPIPITAVVSDQGGALFGCCGFNRGDVKATLGTGAFLNINTGKKAHASYHGIYPCVGWKDSRGIVYMAEGSSNDNGTIIEWGIKMGFYNTPDQTSDMASSVKDSNDVFFIPAFQGIQAPVNDSKSTGGFIGVTSSCTKEHLVRAMLESLAFRIYLIYLTLNTETSYEILNLRVDGGVAQNNFILQMVSTLTDKKIEKPKNIEASSLGCCFLAGLGAGVWKDYSDISQLRTIDKVFEPIASERKKILKQFNQWQDALKRFGHWKKNEGSKNKLLS